LIAGQRISLKLREVHCQNWQSQGKLSLLPRPVEKEKHMKRALSVIILLAAAAWAAGQTPSPTPAPARTAPPAPHTNLKVGQAAPDFTLPSTAVGPDGRGLRFKLSDFKGKKNVVLAFYVLAFTGG